MGSLVYYFDDCPVFQKPQWILYLCTMHSTSGATSPGPLNASIVDKPILSTHLLAYRHWWDSNLRE